MKHTFLRVLFTLLLLTITSISVANTVNMGTSVANNLTLYLGSLNANPNVSFPQISYANKDNPETLPPYDGILAYTTTNHRSIAVTMTSLPSNPGGNPYLAIQSNAMDNHLDSEETEIPYTVSLSSCHPTSGSPTTFELKDSIPEIINFPNSFQNSCFSFLGGTTGTLSFTRLGIPGPLPVTGAYTGTITLTLSLL